MGKGDHSDVIFSPTTDASVYAENDLQVAVADGTAVRSRHLSQLGPPVPGVLSISIFGSLPVLSKFTGSGFCGNGYIIKDPVKNVELRKSLLRKDAEVHQQDTQIQYGSARRNMVLGILLLTNLINYMDRYTIAGVLDEVKNFYSINNGEAGLLQTSFIISYMVLSPVFGYLGDRYNRKYIMASGIFFWSTVTLLGSFVPRDKYLVFLFLRALVGVGEASYSTIAPSLIADIVPKSMRTKALSIFFLAVPVGSGLGYIVGSKVATHFGSWQWALRVTPMLGVLCTILVLVVVVEPGRGAADGAAHGNIRRTSFLSDVSYLVKHKTFMLLSLGFTCVTFVAGALALWAPLYMYQSMQVQQVNMDAATVSLIFGVITCAAGFSGVAIGSYAASRLRSVTRCADPLVCAFGLISSAPFVYLAVFLSKHNPVIPWVMIFLGETLLSLNWALVTDILLCIIVPTRRSTAEAFQILMSHAFGDAGSPYLVGVISDAITLSFGHKDLIVEYVSLQYALYIPCFICVIGGGFFLATALYIDEDRKETEKVIKEASKSSNDTSSASLTGTTTSGSQTTEGNLTDIEPLPLTDPNSSESSCQDLSQLYLTVPVDSDAQTPCVTESVEL